MTVFAIVLVFEIWTTRAAADNLPICNFRCVSPILCLFAAPNGSTCQCHMDLQTDPPSGRQLGISNCISESLSAAHTAADNLLKVPHLQQHLNHTCLLSLVPSTSSPVRE